MKKTKKQNRQAAKNEQLVIKQVEYLGTTIVGTDQNGHEIIKRIPRIKRITERILHPNRVSYPIEEAHMTIALSKRYKDSSLAEDAIKFLNNIKDKVKARSQADKAAYYKKIADNGGTNRGLKNKKKESYQ